MPVPRTVIQQRADACQAFTKATTDKRTVVPAGLPHDSGPGDEPLPRRVHQRPPGPDRGPQRFGAIEAGGVLGLLDGHAETHTLAEVRRIHEEWERQASLELRERNPEALATYDTHGRLLSYESAGDALDAAAQAAVTADSPSREAQLPAADSAGRPPKGATRSP